MKYSIISIPLHVVEKELIKNGSPLALEWAKDEKIKKDLADSFSDFYMDFQKVSEVHTLKGHIQYFLDNAKASTK